MSTAAPADAIYVDYLSGPDVAALALADDEIVAAVEAGLAAQGRGETVIEPRMHLEPRAGVEGHFNVLRGYIAPLALAGVKVVGDFVDNWRQNLPSEMGLLTLFDPRTGRPVAIVDAAGLTDMRTGAVTAIGARHLARRSARVLGHIRAARPTGTCACSRGCSTSTRSGCIRAGRTAAPRSPNGSPATWAAPSSRHPTKESYVRDADIVVEASRLSRPEPLLRTEWIKRGALVVPYGTMSAVELSLTDIMSKVVVDDWGQCRAGQFGSLRAHVDAGKLSEATLYAELGQIVAGSKPGRERDDETILLWHRGLRRRHRARRGDAREGEAPRDRHALATRDAHHLR
jgi:ornithine cyclodeaminase